MSAGGGSIGVLTGCGYVLAIAIAIAAYSAYSAYYAACLPTRWPTHPHIVTATNAVGTFALDNQDAFSAESTLATYDTPPLVLVSRVSPDLSPVMIDETQPKHPAIRLPIADQPQFTPICLTSHSTSVRVPATRQQSCCQPPPPTPASAYVDRLQSC